MRRRQPTIPLMTEPDIDPIDLEKDGLLVGGDKEDDDDDPLGLDVESSKYDHHHHHHHGGGRNRRGWWWLFLGGSIFPRYYSIQRRLWISIFGFTLMVLAFGLLREIRASNGKRFARKQKKIFWVV